MASNTDSAHLTTSAPSARARDGLPPAAEALFRIARESLAKVAEYARAEHGTLTFGVTPQASSLTIVDEDHAP